jgi:putative ABC transport system permease protein
VADFLRDLRHTVRVLVRSPRFSLTVILTLAIGIGVNVANFSIVESFLFRPLRYDNPDELVHLYRVDKAKGNDQLRFSLPSFVDLQDRATSFQSLAAYNYFGANLAGGGTEALGLTISRMSGNMFEVLGVEAAHGRTFNPADAVDGRIIVLSHGLWQRHFGGREELVGQTIEIDEEPYAVIGVMPLDFNFPFGGVKAWVPIDAHDARWDREVQNFMPVARLQPDIALGQAEAELASLYTDIQQQHYPDDEHIGTQVKPLRESLLFLYDMVRLMLALLSVASAFLLLIICTNIANLFLLRAITREREVAVRAALGAGRMSLVRKLLAEGLVLALVGGALGALMAFWLLRVLAPVIPEDLYHVGEIGLDGSALVFSLLVSLVTVAVFAVPPALRAFKADLTLSLKDAGSSTQGSVKARRSQDFLVVAQVAVAATLLVGTALAVRSFINMHDVESGFDLDQVLTVQMTVPKTAYPEPVQVTEFHRQVLERVGSLPGVESAAFIQPLPMNFETWDVEIEVEGRDQPDGRKPSVGEHFVSSEYFAAMGMPLLRGRSFGDQDDLEAPTAVIVNQTMADRFWPGGSPLGERIRYEQAGEEKVATVIGVVGDTKRMFLNDDDQAIAYFSQSQRPYRGNFLVVRTSGDPLAATAEVRGQIWSVRSNLPLSAIRSMRQVVDQSMRPWTWSAMILAVFAAFALFLAGLGIYGVVGYAASQRTSEIGVRMALGAVPRDILRLILKKALTLAGVGVTLGGVAALGLSRAMGTVLYGVGANDPATYGLVLIVLGAVAVVASLAPAVQAARVDPAIALRHE